MCCLLLVTSLDDIVSEGFSKACEKTKVVLKWTLTCGSTLMLGQSALNLSSLCWPKLHMALHILEKGGLIMLSCFDYIIDDKAKQSER